MPTGLGKLSPKARTIRRESPAAGRRRGRESQGLDGKRMGVFRIERPQQWPGQAVEKADQWALRSKSAGTLSAVTAFFKVGLDKLRLRL